VAGDTNGTSDVFVRDLETGVTQRVSVNSEGVEGKGVSGSPTLSTSGRYVAFTSNANNLVARDTNRNYDVFVHDLITKKTRRVSLSSAGAEGNSQSSAPKISANGRYVVFESSASNLVAEDKNGVLDVFVRDLATGVTKIISVDSVDVKGNSESRMPSISGSGRYVAFSSTASNLVEGDNLGFEDIFVRRQW
jgi:Tol biopolymer transport system component